MYMSVPAAGDAEHTAWADRGGEVLHLHGEGHYINMNRFDTPDSTETCFPPKYWARLQMRRLSMNPHNLFLPLDYYRADHGFSDMAADTDFSNEA